MWTPMARLPCPLWSTHKSEAERHANSASKEATSTRRHISTGCEEDSAPISAAQRNQTTWGVA